MRIHEFANIFKDCEIIGEKIVIKSDLAKTINFIKNDCSFNMLKDITAVDTRDNGIELIYRMYSTENEEELVISITVNEETESISKIFDSAMADEKEIYDLFGINFIGNDELERLYMPESWKGHPLRKDYEEKDERLNWNE